jgi:short-subunit dehydrogenase
MPTRIEDSVVVITGASRGIGRATAQAFARRGAALLLAARREEVLDEVVAECEAAGGQAIAVPTDVTDQDAVHALARQGIETHGRIDTWINNAGVTLFAPFEEAPPDVYRRVIETNLFGVVHGARAVLPYFREQGMGVLINMSSVVSRTPQPYTSAYVASKYAVRGFSSSLRMELALEDVDIHVVHMMPASIDTPLFQHAANYTGRQVKALDPAISPHRVAEAAVKAAASPKAEVTVGMLGRMATAEHAAVPRIYERLGSRVIDRGHFEEAPAAPTQGNLFTADANSNSVKGGWGSSDSNGRAVGKGVAATVAAASIPLAIWGWRKHRERL